MTETYGNIVWFTIREEAEVEHGAFCAAILESGANTMLPHAPKPSDVFKRACKAAANSFQGEHGIEWVPKSTDNSYVYRDLMWDSGVAATVGFHKPTERIAVAKKFTDNQEISDAVDSLQVFIDQKSATLTAYAIREFVRRTIETEFFALRAKNFHFVADFLTYTERLEGLQRVLDSFDYCEMDLLPVPATEKQRAMLERELLATVSQQVEEACGGIDAILANEKTKITKDRFMAYSSERAGLVDQIVLFRSAGIVQLDDVVAVYDPMMDRIEEKLQVLVGKMKV